MQTLPALPALVLGCERSFHNHLELELKGGKSAVLRIAGRELQLSKLDEPADALVPQLCQSLAEIAAFGLVTVLTDESTAGTRLRMDLISALAHLEATKGPRKEKHADDGEVLLTTADAASQLGMSRPYVSMLCNQGKLGQVHRSEGGHRRIRQSAVDEYKRVHSNVTNDKSIHKDE